MGVSRPRAVGVLLLAVPITFAVASPLFPSYDARARYFVSYFSNIVEAGDRYLVALILFAAISGIIAILAVTLSRSSLRSETSVSSVVVGGSALAAFGFGLAAVTGVPVWWWAGRAADGSEPIREMALRSQGLASISQTVLLMLGFGGFLISMSVLGVLAAARGWVPRLLLWATVGVALISVVIAAVQSGPAVWLALGGLPMLWALTFGVVLVVRGTFGPEISETASDG